jgi:ATP-dependent DNA ligase
MVDCYFEEVVKMDLEGIVCKREDSALQGDGEAFALLDQGQELEV